MVHLCVYVWFEIHIILYYYTRKLFYIYLHNVLHVKLNLRNHEKIIPKNHFYEFYELNNIILQEIILITVLSMIKAK